MSRGCFITLEGGEGVGKTSSLHCVAETLRSWGLEVTVTREPGGTPFGEQLRELILAGGDMAPETELLMMFAARVEHVRQVIRPALAEGRWVLSDRFTDASYAYQGGGRGIPSERIRSLAEWTLASLEPDLTILLDAPVEIGLARARRRGTIDRFESENAAFLERVRRAYLERADLFPQRIALIDANRPAATVQADIIVVLERRFADGLRNRH